MKKWTILAGTRSWLLGLNIRIRTSQKTVSASLGCSYVGQIKVKECPKTPSSLPDFQKLKKKKWSVRYWVFLPHKDLLVCDFTHLSQITFQRFNHYEIKMHHYIIFKIKSKRKTLKKRKRCWDVLHLAQNGLLCRVPTSSFINSGCWDVLHLHKTGLIWCH